MSPHLPSLFIALVLVACGEGAKTVTEPRQGLWRMELDLNGPLLPFTFELAKADSSAWTMLVHNSTEKIEVTDVSLLGDTILMRMPLFDSEFRGVVVNDTTIVGRWHNYLKGPEYSIPFHAVAGTKTRFPGGSVPSANISGAWRTHFSAGTPDAYNAIGEFRQDSAGVVSGTFMTETGDYRFLEGVLHGDSLLLSCFDGSHAFLFQAVLRGDSLHGHYMSGVHWQEHWVAVRDANYELRDPDSLTTLREGYGMVDFRFPDLEGNMVARSDEAFRGKPMMVQVMGSWCPNCVDEARLLSEVHGKYHVRGLEILAIAFEKYEDPDQAIGALKRFKKTLGVPYPVLYGGAASKEVAGSKLPFLDHLMSYPTCIFIDRNGMVRRIRTGFYGPGTGEHHEHYKRNLDAFIETLLDEEFSMAQTR
ncbi:MAG: TlpA family protein disulfide reductase [Flavobacteriales bacterium]|nr:TlpA family protein disulfide reductase [Flavobacteriales bacterium]